MNRKEVTTSFGTSNLDVEGHEIFIKSFPKAPAKNHVDYPIYNLLKRQEEKYQNGLKKTIVKNTSDNIGTFNYLISLVVKDQKLNNEQVEKVLSALRIGFEQPNISLVEL